MAKERIGILGSAFDPIHDGHLQMALRALDSAQLNRLLVIPAADDAYKPCIAGQEDRWKMVVAACSQDPRLVPSRLEMDRNGTAYTVDTLLALRKEYPKADLLYLLGVDGVMKLRNWHRLKKVLSLCSFLVCSREGDVSPIDFHEELVRLQDLGGQFVMLRMEPVDCSSSEIRSCLAAGREPSGISVPIQEFCELKGLYGAPVRLSRASGWLDQLFFELKPRRFSHSLAVAAYARRLAGLHGISQKQAEEAGILHDCAKCLPLKEMQRIALNHRLTEDPAFLESGALLHSIVGAQVARDRYGMEDPEVLEAIAYHNTGHSGMSRLAMCVCLADSIEPTRENYPGLEEIRNLAETSLERALLKSLERTASFVRQQGKYLHPQTQGTIAWLRTLPECRS